MLVLVIAVLGRITRLLSEVQLAKALPPISTKDSGNTMFDNDVQPLNTPLAISVSVSGKFTVVREVQPLNAE